MQIGSKNVQISSVFLCWNSPIYQIICRWFFKGRKNTARIDHYGFHALAIKFSRKTKSDPFRYRVKSSGHNDCVWPHPHPAAETLKPKSGCRRMAIGLFLCRYLSYFPVNWIMLQIDYSLWPCHKIRKIGNKAFLTAKTSRKINRSRPLWLPGRQSEFSTIPSKFTLQTPIFSFKSKSTLEFLLDFNEKSAEIRREEKIL